MSRPYADESVYRAVAHPARRKMLDLLRQRERPVGELIEQFAMNRQTVSHHLRILRSTGLIKHKRNGRQLVYYASAAQLREVYKWLILYQGHWNPRSASDEDGKKTSASPSR